MQSRRNWGGGLIVAAAAVTYALFGQPINNGTVEEAAAMYLSRGTFVVPCGLPPEASEDSGIDFLPLSAADAGSRAWAQGDGRDVGRWLADNGWRGLALAPYACGDEPGAAIQALRAHEAAWPLVGRYLASAMSYYELSQRNQVDADLGRALATVARAVLSGEQRPPRVDSFPGSLRQLGSTEMMVLLRDGPQPRLWRSARGRSRAQALLTAISYARSRWAERESAMGGGLRASIARLHVEVIEVEHHGVIATSEPAFVDAVVTDGFGVGYEQAGRWRYVLPRATASAGGGTVALNNLLEDNGLTWADLERPDVRAYRFRAVQLGVSEPTGEAGSLQD